MNKSWLLVGFSFLLLGTVYGVSTAVRKSREKALFSQAGNPQSLGDAGRSLATEKMKISPNNRRKGLIGELGIAAEIDRLSIKYGLIALHDLSLPDSKANIDHILITAKCIFVIDAKNYDGIIKISKSKNGNKRLRIGKSDQTKLADKLNYYAGEIKEFLDSELLEVQVVPLLAFYKAKFHEDSATSINGVKINIFGIENELLRYAKNKQAPIDMSQTARLILSRFPPKA